MRTALYLRLGPGTFPRLAADDVGTGAVVNERPPGFGDVGEEAGHEVHCLEGLGGLVTLVDGLLDDCGRVVAQKRGAEGWFDFPTRTPARATCASRRRSRTTSS